MALRGGWCRRNIMPSLLTQAKSTLVASVLLMIFSSATISLFVFPDLPLVCTTQAISLDAATPKEGRSKTNECRHRGSAWVTLAAGPAGDPAVNEIIGSTRLALISG